MSSGSRCLVGAAVLLLVGVVIAVAGCGGGGAATQSESETPVVASASSDGGTVEFGDPREVSNHREIDVHFEGGEGDLLAGTLYLPQGDGPHPAVVDVPSSGRAHRNQHGTAGLTDLGLAVFSYDKRGVAESEGVCCAPDFELLAADAAAAVNALLERPEINAEQVGLIGASQAGWVIPIAAVGSVDVAFTVVITGPTVTFGEEALYSQLTGDEQCADSGLSAEEISQQLAEAGPSGFDPVPYLERMTVPGLWLFGELDKSLPVGESVAILERLVGESGQDFTVEIFSDAKHGLIAAQTGGCWEEIENPQLAPGVSETLASWLLARVDVVAPTSPTSDGAEAVADQSQADQPSVPLSEDEEEYASSVLEIDQRSIREIGPLLNAIASEYIANPSPGRESFEALAKVSGEAADLTQIWAQDVGAIVSPERYATDHEILTAGLEALAVGLSEIAEQARVRDAAKIDEAIERALAEQSRATVQLSAEFSRLVPGFLSVGA